MKKHTSLMIVMAIVCLLSSCNNGDDFTENDGYYPWLSFKKNGDVVEATVVLPVKNVVVPGAVTVTSKGSVIPGNTKATAGGTSVAFMGFLTEEIKQTVQTLTLQEGVKSVKANAMTGCTNLTRVIASETLTANTSSWGMPNQVSLFNLDVVLQTRTVMYFVDGNYYEQQVTAVNAKYMFPNNPTKTGYTFAGWFTNGDIQITAETTIPSGSISVPINLFAKWTPNTYWVTYVVDDNIYTQRSILFDSAYVFPSNPVKTGYIFSGWFMIVFEGALGEKRKVVEGAKMTAAMNHSLKAEWTVAQYSVTFKKNDGTTEASTITQTYDANYVLPTAPTRNDYTFAGWNTQSDGSGMTVDAGTKMQIADNSTLYAKWIPNDPDSI